ncbi:MAG: SagB/ThcOx family dehydrogenase [Bryobacteraceae bacterium]
MRRSLLPVALLAPCLLLAQELKPVELPPPQTEGGKPLMQALKERKSTREFGPRPLPVQVLSNLLWAAFGVNRPDGHRTAPSASNMQEIDIFVALPEGLYLYDAKAHRLNPVLAEDIRAATGTQAFVGQAPLNLVYVADYARMGKRPDEAKVFYSAADTGFIAQNVYLFCASEGLNTVVRASIDREKLAARMKLRPDERIVLAQTVGYPPK